MVDLGGLFNAVSHAIWSRPQQQQQQPDSRYSAKASATIGNSGTTTSSDSGENVTSPEEALNDVLSDANGGTNGGTDGGTGQGTTGDGSATGDSSSSGGGVTSPLLEGEMSFEELVGEICNGIDLIFATKRTTVVITDYEGIYAEAKYLRDLGHDCVKGEDLSLWQLEDGSYELDVSEYGFYNTVKVHYKNGVVTESYEDLVRVYSEVAIDYYEPKLDKTSAIMKAKAYLAAHVRDFDMSVKAKVLHDGDIDIGDIVTIENPLTMRDHTRKYKEGRDPEYFFVMGKSVEWEGDSFITCDLELRYGAASPEKLEVPETGASYTGGSSDGSSSSGGTGTTGNVKQAIDEVGKLASKISYSGACQTHDCVKSQHTGDCWGMSDYIACELKSRGVNAKILEYGAIASNHRSVKYQDSSGKWVRFPYREYGVSYLFRDTDNVENGSDVKTTC